MGIEDANQFVTLVDLATQRSNIAHFWAVEADADVLHLAEIRLFEIKTAKDIPTLTSAEEDERDCPLEHLGLRVDLERSTARRRRVCYWRS